jgi:aminoglycoside phosphotransferase (APT) family kinase protein
MSAAAPLPTEALAWVVSSLPGARRVVGHRRLTGGITSVVHALRLDGYARMVVLRQWVPGHGLPNDSNDASVAVAREAAVLTALATADLPVPRLLAIDETGRRAGHPSVLMTRVPGRIDLTPDDPQGWTRRVAELLPRIHEVQPTLPMPSFESWLGVEHDPPAWSNRPEIWRAAIAMAREPMPATSGGFVHHDYQPFNLLWSRGSVTGIVDWVWASQGPPDEDVTHCRLNLCLLHGPDRADDFQRIYESVAGRRLDRWWDIASLVDFLGWTPGEVQRQAGRRLRIDQAAMPLAVEALLIRALAR